MAFRFRRSIKIAPGIRVNLNKKSTSVRIGPRGLGYTISSTGQQRVSAGIPGTGLSYSEVVSPKQKQPAYEPVHLVDAEPKPKSKGPVVLLLLAIVFGVGWCSGRSDQSSSPATSTRAPAAQTQQAQPASEPAPATGNQQVAAPQPPSNVSVAHRTVTPAVPAPVTLFTTAGVRLRAEPSTGSGIILTVPASSAVKSSRTEGLWHYVTYGAYAGWIRGDYLATRRPAPERSAPARAVPLVSTPSRARSTGRYIRGPRGGCYYINRNGNKTYVDRSMCG